MRFSNIHFNQQIFNRNITTTLLARNPSANKDFILEAHLHRETDNKHNASEDVKR